LAAHYIFNLVGNDARDRTDRSLRRRTWHIDADEPHRDELAPGDLVLVYLGAPERVFLGRAVVTAAKPDVSLGDVEEWDPPVPMSTVLAGIDRSAGARADFETGVVRITEQEYETALAVAHRSG
jgi:hypothetical protein